MQDYTDAVVQDWRGFVDLFACVLDEWKDKSFAFKGVSTLDAISIDVVWDKGKIIVIVHPNGAEKLVLPISADCGQIHASGHDQGPAAFSSHEKVVL